MRDEGDRSTHILGSLLFVVVVPGTGILGRHRRVGRVPNRRIEVERYERRGLRILPDREQGRGPQLWGEGPAFPSARYVP
jgi:hypothetical protein